MHIHMSEFPADFEPLRLIDMMTRTGHNRLLGTQYCGHGAGWCELELPYDDRLVSDPETGILASGPIFTLMDTATSVSVWLKTGRFQPQATLDLRIDYLRPATPGKSVFGFGECYHVTKSIAFVRGHAHDGDPEKLIANVAGTYFFTASA
jgi:uncharacterized protein (TIGR00369 family)